MSDNIGDHFTSGVPLKTGETRFSAMDSRRRAALSRLIGATMKQLIARPLSMISLGDVLDDAAIGRATFYKLFDDFEHLARYIADELHAQLRTHQVAGLDGIDPADWRSIFGELGDRTAEFYAQNPVAMRLWLSSDSPVSLRVIDHASDDAFVRWIDERYGHTSWHRRVREQAKDIDIITASFRIYDAVLSLGFEQFGIRLPRSYYGEAKRARFPSFQCSPST